LFDVARELNKPNVGGKKSRRKPSNYAALPFKVMVRPYLNYTSGRSRNGEEGKKKRARLFTTGSSFCSTRKRPQRELTNENETLWKKE